MMSVALLNVMAPQKVLLKAKVLAADIHYPFSYETR
jgi:hypothetical protein